MTCMDLLDRVTIEPDKLGGKPCIRGIRIRVSDVLGLLAHGLTPAQVLAQFPYLEPEDITACLEYAAKQVDRAEAKIA